VFQEFNEICKRAADVSADQKRDLALVSLVETKEDKKKTPKKTPTKKKKIDLDEENDFDELEEELEFEN
jgi:hypothetical protein